MYKHILIYNLEDLAHVCHICRGINFEWSPNSNIIPGKPYCGRFIIEADFYEDVRQDLKGARIKHCFDPPEPEQFYLGEPKDWE